MAKGDAFFTKQRKRKRGPAESSSSQRSFSKSRKPEPSTSAAAAKKKRKDEELDSAHSESDDEVGGDIDNLDLRESDIDENASGEEYENETPAQKRLRLANVYLQSVKEDLASGEVDAADLDRELIASRLRQDVLQHSGKVHLFLANSLPITTSSTPPPSTSFRRGGHRLALTSSILSESGHTLFTSGKEGNIIQWDVRSGKRIAVLPKAISQFGSSGSGFQKQADRKGKGKMKMNHASAKEGHTDEVLALALSSDGKILASAGRDRLLGVWDVSDENPKWIRSFGGHRDIISSLAFRKGSSTLYTASYDRTIKSFSLAPSSMGYIETLFGHQDPITSLDALRGETAVSAGGQDKTVRYWKVVDETQLVFRGGGKSKLRELLEEGAVGEAIELAESGGGDTAQASSSSTKAPAARSEGFIEGRIDCVAMLDESTFVSGGDSGSISLWSTTKKKPLFSQALAHGVEEHVSEYEPSTVKNPRWITSLAVLAYSDIFVSGSWDGRIRLWKLDRPSSSQNNAISSFRSFSHLYDISLPGVINSLQLIRPPAGALREHKWLAETSFASTGSGSATPAEGKEQDILLVVGVGQEPRLGRWVKVKEGGARNASVIYALTRQRKGLTTAMTNGHEENEDRMSEDEAE